MKIKTYLIDAFTNEAFKGNPAGVCLLEEPISEVTMQNMAMEINAAETAFLSRKSEAEFDIRYFTPLVEIPFCGHATLASAKMLLTNFDLNEVHFTTYFDLKVSARSVSEGVQLDFPLYDTVPYQISEELLEALTIQKAVNVRLCEPIKKLLLEVDSLDTLQNLTPDFKAMLKANQEIRSVSVTVKGDEEYDFYSRMFGPWVGIDEDPVTGVAHTMLAKYWGDKLGKTKMRAFQCSKRGGYLNLSIKGEKELQVISNAVIALEGWMSV